MILRTKKVYQRRKRTETHFSEGKKGNKREDETNLLRRMQTIFLYYKS